MSVLQRTSRRYQTGATSLLLRQFAAITVAGVFQDLCRWNDLMYEAHKKVMEKLRKQACDLLGAEGVLVNLDDWMGDSGARQLRLERQCGLEQQEAWLAFNDGRRGHYVYVGLELFRWEVCEPAIRLVRVSVPPLPRMEDFWVVAREDVVRFYRQYRRTHRNRQPAQAPLMEPQLATSVARQHDWPADARSRDPAKVRRGDETRRVATGTSGKRQNDGVSLGRRSVPTPWARLAYRVWCRI